MSTPEIVTAAILLLESILVLACFLAALRMRIVSGAGTKADKKGVGAQFLADLRSLGQTVAPASSGLPARLQAVKNGVRLHMDDDDELEKSGIGAYKQTRRVDWCSRDRSGSHSMVVPGGRVVSGLGTNWGQGWPRKPNLVTIQSTRQFLVSDTLEGTCSTSPTQRRCRPNSVKWP